MPLFILSNYFVSRFFMNFRYLIILSHNIFFSTSLYFFHLHALLIFTDYMVLWAHCYLLPLGSFFPQFILQFFYTLYFLLKKTTTYVLPKTRYFVMLPWNLVPLLPSKIRPRITLMIFNTSWYWSYCCAADYMF